jgi:gamma-glutamylcyclotransferase (GGCT)/AIG2-like uncharacterized protein YtfP
MSLNKVFVYGTLKQDHKIRGINKFDGVKFIGHATTMDPWFDMADLGAFPAAVPGGDSYISGEVWEVTPEVMDQLDLIEGFPTFYLRQITETTLGPAWMYYLPERMAHDEDWIDPDSYNILTWENT